MYYSFTSNYNSCRLTNKRTRYTLFTQNNYLCIVLKAIFIHLPVVDLALVSQTEG